MQAGSVEQPQTLYLFPVSHLLCFLKNLTQISATGPRLRHIPAGAFIRTPTGHPRELFHVPLSGREGLRAHLYLLPSLLPDIKGRVSPFKVSASPTWPGGVKGVLDNLDADTPAAARDRGRRWLLNVPESLLSL